MGGAAVLHAMATEPLEPRALILESVFERLLTTVEHRFQSMGLPAFPAAELLVFWGGVAGGFDGFAHNPVDFARHVRVPTLILQGDRDLRVQVAEGQAIHAQLQGPKQIVIADAGHAVSDSMDAGRWNAIVATFLRGPAASRGAGTR